MSTQPLTSLAELGKLFESGTRPYGEGVSQKEHMLQCARFGELEGKKPSIILAALLHDIGHIVGDPDETKYESSVDDRHEEVGADLLKFMFPPVVTEPIRLHVMAKRYLVAKKPGYRETLSDASRKTLEMQGGPLTDDECAAFEKNPYFADALLCRELDEKGKVPGMVTRPLSGYLSLIDAFLHPAARLGAPHLMSVHGAVARPIMNPPHLPPGWGMPAPLSPVSHPPPPHFGVWPAFF